MLAIIGGSLGQFVAWIGAVVNTARLDDKTWFVVLLVLGLLSFGFIAMLVYVLAGPDGTAPAPAAAPGNSQPDGRSMPSERRRAPATDPVILLPEVPSCPPASPSTASAGSAASRLGHLIERTPDIEVVAVNDLVPVALERDPVQARLDLWGLRRASSTTPRTP